ncbi:PadR family transcriptional regulator [Paenibacillus hemerocallicola]|uniref:PadR family transcriptional regulator n=2 Tax=Paenibacillus hemerocallicola TaxID=1172614 RepID=A0A5C4TD60_9BACL|nr:PadR family transcriptional regulator [Paenibacillus hemerocallicola]TNJ66941.1 PadR family transcriptional regulator [Paenibacillus hemerocallicola]
MSMRLVILGLLMEGDSHPYEIRQKMIEREMHRFMKMKDGSLYYAIDQLKKDGMIETVEVVRDSNRPDKTIYRITEAGKASFQTLLLEQMEADAPYHHPMHTALPFCHYGDPMQIAAVLRRKLELVEQRTERMRQVYEEHIPIVPRGVLHLMISGYEHGLTTADWLRRLIRDAEDGRLYEIGTPIEAYPPSGTSPDAGGRDPENS